MITVVDAQGFLKDYRSLEGVLDREELVKEMGLAPLAIKGKKPTKKEKKIAEDLQTTRASARNHPISSLLAEQGLVFSFFPFFFFFFFFNFILFYFF